MIRGLRYVLTLFAAAGLCLTQLTAHAQINDLRISSGPSRVRIVLDLDAPAVYTDTSGGTDISLEIKTGAKNSLTRSLKDPVVKEAVLTRAGKEKSTLRVKLGKDAPHKVLVLKQPHRIVLDVYRIQIIKTTKDLGDGLSYTYWQDDMKGLPVRLHVLSLKPDGGYYLKPFSGSAFGNGRGRLLSAASIAGARAAVNACYFDTDGWVIGNCKWDGSFFGMDTTPRSALVVDQDGKASVQQDLAYRGSVSFPGARRLEIKGINRRRIAQDLVLFNSNYGAGTRTNEYGREVKLVDGQVTDISMKGDMSLEKGALVLSGHGINASALAVLRRGDRVTVEQTLGSQSADEARLVVGAGPSLMENGQVKVRSQQEVIAPDIAYGRAPRTGAGVKEDGTVLLMVVDGRSADSAGMTLQEFAGYFQRFGAVEAVNFDGGGSSEMVLDRKILNHPSDGAERPVSIGLGLFKK